jgi:hypothetical protein
LNPRERSKKSLCSSVNKDYSKHPPRNSRKQKIYPFPTPHFHLSFPYVSKNFLLISYDELIFKWAVSNNVCCGKIRQLSFLIEAFLLDWQQHRRLQLIVRSYHVPAYFSEKLQWFLYGA